jgi:hypothetical protein
VSEVGTTLWDARIAVNVNERVLASSCTTRRRLTRSSDVNTLSGVMPTTRLLFAFVEGGAMPNHRCSFCGAANTEVTSLFVHPSGVSICDECVVKLSQRLPAARKVKPQPMVKLADRKPRIA